MGKTLNAGITIHLYTYRYIFFPSKCCFLNIFYAFLISLDKFDMLVYTVLQTCHDTYIRGRKTGQEVKVIVLADLFCKDGSDAQSPV